MPKGKQPTDDTASIGQGFDDSILSLLPPEGAQGDRSVRQIAVDLGESLGCGGYCSALRRTEVGDLSVNSALAPEDVQPGCGISLLEAVGHIPRVDLDEAGLAEVVHGRRVQASGMVGMGTVALAADDELVAIGLADDDGVVRPKVVLIS